MKESNNSVKELEDLLVYEKASRIVCMKYENSCKSYDGTITNGNEYKQFQIYNGIHEKVITKIQKILNEADI